MIVHANSTEVHERNRPFSRRELALLTAVAIPLYLALWSIVEWVLNTVPLSRLTHTCVALVAPIGILTGALLLMLGSSYVAARRTLTIAGFLGLLGVLLNANDWTDTPIIWILAAAGSTLVIIMNRRSWFLRIG